MDLLTPDLVRTVLGEMGYANVSADVVSGIMANSKAQLHSLSSPEAATDAYYGPTDSDESSNGSGDESSDEATEKASPPSASVKAPSHEKLVPRPRLDSSGDASTDRFGDGPLYADSSPPPKRAPPPAILTQMRSPRRSMSVRTRGGYRGGVPMSPSRTSVTSGRTGLSRSVPWDSRHGYAKVLTPDTRPRTRSGLTPAMRRDDATSVPPPVLSMTPTSRRDPDRGVIMASTAVSTSRSQAPRPGSRSRINDPVARYQSMQRRWKDDPFLRQQGRASLRWRVRCSMLE